MCGGIEGGKNGGKGDNVNGAKNNDNCLKQLTANTSKFKCQIKTLKRKLKGDDDTATASTANEYW